MNTILSKIREYTELNNTLNEINETLDRFDLNCSSNKIEYGSKVLADYGDGKTIEGRVWGFGSDGKVKINRIGYKSFMYFNINSLTNISVGTIGKLEKKQWILEQTKNELFQEISNYSFDFIELGINPLNKNQTIEIEVINSIKIEYTKAYLVTLKKSNENIIRKIVFNNIELKSGNYKFEITNGFLSKIKMI
jgi:hypothetical protein